ncbi:MAG TPA: ferritin-like domain-containing protein [Gemmatimonadales bacterium]|nr:ferritin-like domain-containing protein [Gemmatimonadales bacterium]
MNDRAVPGAGELEFLSQLARATSRRKFLEWSGVTLAVAVVGCGDDDNGMTGPGAVSAADSTATVPATVAGGSAVTITVQAKDAGGRNLTSGGAAVAATVTGANSAGPISAVDNGDGTYTLTYTPANTGSDAVAITLNGTAISGSPFTVTVTSEAVSLGTGDAGVLNYAYALEQLEAAFYTQAVASLYTGATAEETRILTDIRDHEVIHRDFLKAALAAGAIPDLSVDFTSVDFTSRDSVLGTARTFEDLGVSAYNGAGQLLESADYLLLAGKIVSVEARHAAAIRDLLNPLSADFAGDDVVDAQGLDQSRLPANVLPLADPFITTPIDASGLPTA